MTVEVVRNPEEPASSRKIETAEQLHDVLMGLNDGGVNPVVVGFDVFGYPFLAYGWAPGGDGWDAGFVSDDMHSAEFDYSDGTERCQECGAFDRRNITKLSYPVRILEVEW